MSKFKEDIDANRMRPNRRLFWVLMFLRLQQNCKGRISKKASGLFKRIALLGSCCEMPASAFVGGGLYMPHVNGVVVSPCSTIGNRLTILQQVTIGVDQFKSTTVGPVIGDRVFIGAGAKIIGPIRIGDDAIIGANAVITKDIPDGATAVGANRIVSRIQIASQSEAVERAQCRN